MKKNFSSAQGRIQGGVLGVKPFWENFYQFARIF